MYAVGKLGSYISRGVVTVAAPFHPFGGAVDIVVVEQEDGSFKSSPWYVQFGKFQGVLKAREKVVSINVNGFDADFRMYLDSRGGAYFLREADEGEGESGSWGDNGEALSNLRRPKKIMSCNYDLQRSKMVSKFEAGNAKVTRSSSTGPRILGFVFGQRSEDGDDSHHQDDAIRRDREGSLERAEIAADLLEVRWSTSLATSKQKKETDSHNSDQHSSVQTPSSVDNDTGSKTDSSTRPHSNGFHNNSIDGGGTEIPLSIDPANFMESFTLEEKHFGVNGVSKSSVGSNVGDARIIQHEEGAYKSDASGISSSNSLLSSGNEHPSTFQIRDADDDSKITIVQSSKVCEVSNGFIEGVDDPTGEHCISANGSKSSAVTHDGVPTVLETKVEVTLDWKTNEGPVKYVEEMVLDQVSTNQERRLTSSLLVEEATSAALNLMENLKSGKNCGSPPTNSTHPGSCENHDEAQFVFSDLESLERKVALTVDKEAEKNPQHHPGRSEEKLDGSTQISRTTSNPISIAGARDQVDQIAPIVDTFSSSWPHGVEINPEDVNHPISRSLDSSFDNMMLVQGDVPSTSETGTQEQQTTPRKSSLEQYQISDKLKELLSDPAVEISLCRHSVQEGMGYEAAAHAFDSEKVDVEKFISLGPDVIKNDKVVVRIGGLYFPWDAALPIVSAIGAPRGEQILEPKGMIHVQHVENAVESYPQQSMDSSNGTWKLWPFKRTMSRRISVVADATSSQRFPAGNTETPKSNTFRSDTFKSETIKKNVMTANTPTSDQLESLNLKYGRNVVTFTFSTPMLGQQKVDAQIYLWKWNARIVISDVDGTITKSDVLGQFMPMVGVDWSQTGVTHLFSAIKKNGYQLLFLSARAISQASLTRQFLFNLKQDGIALPEGPVVISPDGLFPSLFREVIRRAPHEFKIACLEDIKALFPLDHSPFYAGFGNRDTDEISYVKVGIPKGKVFIINPKGEVAVHRCVDTKSYTSLHDLVHEMFPHPTSVPHTEKEDYNNWNFWRLPPPDVLP